MNKLTLLDRVQEKRLEKFLKEIGESRAVERFLSNYEKLNTKTTYSAQLALYFRWLRTKGIQMTPDELIRDNLECLYKSDPIDISTKRRHTDWLLEYVNSYLMDRGVSESMRRVAAGLYVQRYGWKPRGNPNLLPDNKLGYPLLIEADSSLSMGSGAKYRLTVRTGSAHAREGSPRGAEFTAFTENYPVCSSSPCKNPPWGNILHALEDPSLNVTGSPLKLLGLLPSQRGPLSDFFPPGGCGPVFPQLLY